MMMLLVHKLSSSSSLLFPSRISSSWESSLLKPIRLSMNQRLNMFSSSSPFSAVEQQQHQLLGPPEIYKTISPPAQEPPSVNSSSASSSSSSSSLFIDPFMDLMLANFNKYRDIGRTSSSSSSSLFIDPFMDFMFGNFNKYTDMGRTENGSPTYFSTGNPLLDFFFHIVPNTTPKSLTRRLELAWNHDPLKALKLMCNLRGVRGTGKSDKEGFHAAALWLHKNHPKTLACNVKSFAEFGYFKDLPDILYRLIEGLEAEKIAREKRRKEKADGSMRRYRSWHTKRLRDYKEGKAGDLEEKILAEKKRAEVVKENARKLREEKTMAKARKAIDRYNSDPDYRFLHDRISDLFAECLISDLQMLNSGDKFRRISFASKWCPSLDLCFDQSTLLCESIARRVFPRHSYPEYENIEEAHYAYRIRDRLRKEVLVPLRKALELPEVYMSSNRWESLPYERVTSVAMTNYTDIFMKHDEERFKKYLESVKRGEKKIVAGALLPHQIIASLYYTDNSEVAELQWQRMVEDLSKYVKLRESLAVCDVSGSMGGKPMEVCIALGLLLSDLSEDPWKGNVITFSTNPQLHKIEGDNLRSKTEFMEHMDWGMSTDFQKVFDLILQVAVTGNLKEDQMIKRVFVFSDMEFDQASKSDWETDYEAIQRKFRERGYMSVPEIVFWNLRDSRATPVEAYQKGVALVSGFSKNLFRLFLEGKDVVKIANDPVTVMERAISGEEYNNLVVVD